MYPESTDTYVPPEDPETLRVKRFRRYLIFGAAALILLFVGQQVLRYLSTGRVVITTNSSSNSITIIKSAISSEDNEEQASTGNDISPVTLKNGASKNFAPGQYLVKVTGPNSTAASQTVDIKSGHTVKYTINLSGNTSFEPVADVNSLDFNVSSQAIEYVDQGSGYLYKLNGSDTLSQLNSKVSFSNINWSGSAGIGQDSSNGLYVVNNGVVTKLSDTPSGTVSTFAIGSDGEIYLSVGNNVFRGTAGSGFTKIYTAGNPVSSISVSPTNDRLALSYSPGEGSAKAPDSVTIIGNSGKVLAHEDGIEAYELAWAPDGKHVATTSSSDTRIFNGSLKQVAVVPNNNVLNLLWQNNSTLLYSTNDQLWRYDLSTGRGEVVAGSASGHGITAITPSPDGAYVYLSVQSTDGSNDDLMIYRYGLSGQTKSSTFLNTLQDSLPYLSGRCFLSLTDFKNPTIQIFGGQPIDNCPAYAQTYVSQKGGDPKSFSYHVTAVPPDTPSGE